MVTTSASGLDPHITPANAQFQLPRIAQARGISVEQVKAVVSKHTEGRQFGILGEPRVNILELNLDLDRQFLAATQAKVEQFKPSQRSCYEAAVLRTGRTFDTPSLKGSLRSASSALGLLVEMK